MVMTNRRGDSQHVRFSLVADARKEQQDAAAYQLP